MLSIIISQYSDVCTSTKLITKLLPGVASDATIKGYSTEGCVPLNHCPSVNLLAAKLFSHIYILHTATAVITTTKRVFKLALANASRSKSISVIVCFV